MGEKKRIEWIDIAKGIAIVCTIAGHTVPYGSALRNLIYSFHMPLFFFLCGCTLRPVQSGELKKAAHQDAKRLLIPVTIVVLADLIAEVLTKDAAFSEAIVRLPLKLIWGNAMDSSAAPTSLGINLPSVGQVWFLLALFWVKQVWRITERNISEQRLLVFTIAAFAGVLASKKVWLPQSLDIVPVALFFVEAGYLLTHSESNSFIKSPISGAAAFFAWIYLSWYKGLHLILATRDYPYTIMCLIVSLVGIITMIQLSQALSGLKISGILSFLGRHSLALLCIHDLDNYLEIIWLRSNTLLSVSARLTVDITLLLLWLLSSRKTQVSIILPNKK